MQKFDMYMTKANKTKDPEKKMNYYLEAIQTAEEKEEWGLSYHARMELNEVYFDNGDYDLFTRNFMWCLELLDENKENMEPEWVMWQYKWLAEKIDRTPFIEKEELEEMLDDLESRFIELGYSLRPVHQYRFIISNNRGETEKANLHFQNWLQSERDEMSDCEVCEKHIEMEYYLHNHSFEKAIELGEVILKGERTCQEVPNKTYSLLIEPLRKKGEKEKAEEYHKKGYEVIKKQSKFLMEIVYHMKYAMEVDIQKAIQIFFDNIETAEESCDYMSKFHFFNTSLKLKNLAKQNGYEIFKFPKHIPESIQLLANEFDLRNENDYFNSLIK